MLDPVIFANEPPDRERKTREEAARIAPSDALFKERGIEIGTRKRKDKARTEAGDLREDAHELREVQVDPPTEITDELGILRNGATKRPESAPKSKLRKPAQYRPSKRRRDSRQRFADIDIRPEIIAAIGLIGARLLRPFSGARLNAHARRTHLEKNEPFVGEGELDIKRIFEALFESERCIEEEIELFIAKAKLRRALGFDLPFDNRPVLEPSLETLIADHAIARQPRRFIEADGIGSDSPFDDQRPKTIARIHHDLAGITRERVRRKKDARDPRFDHPLEDHTHTRRRMLMLRLEVGKDPRSKERGPDLFDASANLVHTPNAKDCLVEPCSGIIFGIFEGPARADREDIAFA